MKVRDLLAMIEKWRETIPSIDDYEVEFNGDTGDIDDVDVDPSDSALVLLGWRK